VCGGGQDDAAIILDQALLPLLKLIERGGDKEKAAAVCFLGTVVEMRPAVAVRATSSGRPLPGGLSHLWLGRSMVCHASGLRGCAFRKCWRRRMSACGNFVLWPSTGCSHFGLR